MLWEIWSRGFPFKQYRFGYEVEDAVERGERPVATENCPDEYVNIMKDCWADRACDRPSFSQVASSLQNMRLKDAC